MLLKNEKIAKLDGEHSELLQEKETALKTEIPQEVVAAKSLDNERHDGIFLFDIHHDTMTCTSAHLTNLKLLS